MAGPLDAPLRDLASTLIDTFVTESGVFRRETVTYDPSTGTEGTTVLEAEVKHTPPENYGFRELEGKTVERGDVKLYIAATDLEAALPSVGRPNATGDLFSPSGDVPHRIMSVMEHRSGDQPALFELQLRR